MMFLHTPSLIEDAKHASVVITSAVAALAATASLFAALRPEPVDVVSVPLFEAIESPAIDATLGADRIYGRVLTTSGEEVTGYLRWNGREASWADVMPATESVGNAVAGLRFGHMNSLQPVNGRTVQAELKSGEVIQVAALASEPGVGLAPLGVEMGKGEAREIPWSQVARIEFLSEPLDRAPSSERLHGTVVTRSGMAFTGYIMWDLDESFRDEVLEGETRFLQFAEIDEIQRRAAGGVRVVTASGMSMVLSGTRDVDRTNRGISVADPGLGNVVIPFDRFKELRLHPATDVATYETFDGGAAIVGTVTTEAGEALQGEIRWDRDEAATWELLDGQYNGVQFHIELDQISWIKKTWLGATVELRDGRSFYLLASNDVNWTNKGIEISSDAGVRLVAWSEFDRIDLSSAPYTEAEIF
jgi:hypothetical protein